MFSLEIRRRMRGFTDISMRIEGHESATPYQYSLMTPRRETITFAARKTG